MWHETLEAKSDTADDIQRFIAHFDLTFSTPVRRLHTDNGCEFVNKRLNGLLRNLGIAHTVTFPYNPRWNGVVERENRSVVERIRTLLISAKLDVRFWAEVGIHAVNTLNVMPKAVLNDVSPYDALHKSAPNLANYRVFGCRAFIPLPGVNRNR